MTADEPVEEITTEQIEDEAPKKKRFRWGCFLILNFWVALIALLIILLFLPVPDSPKEVEEVVGEHVIEGGGARIEIVSAESIGPPQFYGPGKASVTRLLLDVRVTNLSNIDQALSLNMFILRDGHGGTYIAHPRYTLYYYEDFEEDPSPWDKLIEPGDTVEARLVFLPLEPAKDRELLVKKGFSWNISEYVTAIMPQKRKPRMQPTTTTLLDSIYTRDKTDLR